MKLKNLNVLLLTCILKPLYISSQFLLRRDSSYILRVPFKSPCIALQCTYKIYKSLCRYTFSFLCGSYDMRATYLYSWYTRSTPRNSLSEGACIGWRGGVDENDYHGIKSKRRVETRKETRRVRGEMSREMQLLLNV